MSTGVFEQVTNILPDVSSSSFKPSKRNEGDGNGFKNLLALKKSAESRTSIADQNKLDGLAKEKNKESEAHAPIVTIDNTLFDPANPFQTQQDQEIPILISTPDITLNVNDTEQARADQLSGVTVPSEIRVKIEPIPEELTLLLDSQKLHDDIMQEAVVATYVADKDKLQTLSTMDILLKPNKEQVSALPTFQVSSDSLLLSTNIIMADSTEEGQRVLSRMLSNKTVEQPAEERDVLSTEIITQEVIESASNDETSFNFRNNSASKFAEEILNLGGMIETNPDGKLIVTFTESLPNRAGALIDPHQQVSLSIKEAVTSGKNEITINMYPKALGAVDIKIEFAIVDGIKEIRNIKISAERRDTLEIIEKSQMELKKSLSEVMDTSKKEATLQFEMRDKNNGQGNGGYFTSSEERANWMNKFSGLVAKETSTEDNGIISGYIHADSVNIRV